MSFALHEREHADAALLADRLLLTRTVEILWLPRRILFVLGLGVRRR